MAKKTLNNVATIITIIVGIIAILVFLKIKDISYILPNPISKDIPFNISIEPSFIEEGAYNSGDGISQRIPLKFKLHLNPNKKITYLQLSDDAVIVDRVNKTSQTQTSSIIWTKQLGPSTVFYLDDSLYGATDSLEAEGDLWACPNCFIGKDRPYIFTFNFIYSENGSTKRAYPLSVNFPIK